MDEAILYDLIFQHNIDNWRDEVEKSDCVSKKIMDKERAALLETLGENNRELINRYRISVENYFDYVHFFIDIKLINLCIKVGIELQKAFDEYNNR